MRKQRLAAYRNVHDGRKRLGVVLGAVGDLGLQRAVGHRVRVAAAVQERILVLHVCERLGIEGHADEVKAHRDKPLS